MRDWNWLRPHTLSLYEYTSNDPVNAGDPDGQATFSLLVTASGGAGAGASTGVGIEIDTKGNIRVLFSNGAGGYAGITAGTNISLQITSADTMDELQGQNANIGISGGEVITGGVDIVLSTEKDPITSKPTYAGVNFNIGVGGGVTPVETHGMLESTEVVKKVQRWLKLRKLLKQSWSQCQVLPKNLLAI